MTRAWIHVALAWQNNLLCRLLGDKPVNPLEATPPLVDLKPLAPLSEVFGVGAKQS
jgi:hypothetical protein